ncbi:MAG: SIMPL domain-containing protein [Patescibacteria group bacterium]|nr:SIMPL domain-containing protein [Patescibacteria group bacterium]MBU1877244.1 SIMPL domain-containing protein [Patescibacteria group bacterium]
MEEIKTESECCLGITHLRKKHTLLLTIVSLFLVVVTISTIVNVYYKIVKPTERQISFTGSGIVYTKPDLALTSFSVIIEAKTINETMVSNAEKMNKVIEVIKGQGVEDKDIKTTDFSIYPRYEYVKEDIYSYYSPTNRKLVGYEMRQTIEVKIRDLKKVGEIIQNATDAGANQIGDLQFTIDNKDLIKEEAREKAIQDAKNKAEKLSSQLGMKLGKIINFSESGITPYMYDLKMESTGMGGGDQIPTIEMGENKTEVTITIVYEIR